MRRLDWQLVRPKRNGGVREPLRMAEMMRRLVTREASGDLGTEDRALLRSLEALYLEETIPPCEAVGAPTVGDDPHWESRIIDEYAEADVHVELEDYLAARRVQPDCARCPYASPYSLFPMDPCEFAAGALEQVLQDPDLRARAQAAMTPDGMQDYADGLEEVLREGRWRPVEALDVADYLEKAIFFLRFWSGHGFAILPDDIDEVLGFPGDVTVPSPVDTESEPTTYH
ncbi:MAG: hypothetical protein ACQEXJ_11000 [Myxococcota bacterium]